MKRFFMTLAAMLLVNIGAFTQSGATLKGDVNGDGKVDVEDVTSLVDLILSGKTYGYFYFGTTQPTAENYQMLSGLVASYTSINDAIGATSSIDAGEVLYMLCPATWTKGKKVVVEDGAGGSYNFIEDVDAETVSGYVIYRTEAWEEATDLTLNFEITGGDEYYWYVGQTDPSSMDSITPLESNAASEGAGWRTIGSQSDLDGISSSNKLWDGTIISVGSTKKPIYVALPNDTLYMYDAAGNISTSGWGNSIGTVIFNGITYYIYSSVANLKSFTFNIY